MKSSSLKAGLVSGLLLSCTVGNSVYAHDYWMLPNEYSTSSDKAKWITVDVTASNTAFIADKSYPLTGIKTKSPDGLEKKIDGYHRAKRKSVFDLELTQEGTYRLRETDNTYFTFFKKANGERGRIRADKQQRVEKLPKNATDVETVYNQGKSSAYVTRKAPSFKSIQPQNHGLELAFVSHPNDLVVSEPFEFKVLLDGKPYLGEMFLEVTREGTLYRDARNGQQLARNSQGEVSFKAAQAGRYLLKAELDKETSNPKADVESHSLYLTFEVQPE